MAKKRKLTAKQRARHARVFRKLPRRARKGHIPLGSAGLPGSPTFRLRLHTGPLKEARRSVARQLKRSKAKVVTTGTEHVYIDVKGNSCEDAQMRLARALQAKGLRRLSTQIWSTSCQRRK